MNVNPDPTPTQLWRSSILFEQFRRTGYLLVPSVVPASVCADLRGGVSRLLNEGVHTRTDETGEAYRVDGIIDALPEVLQIFQHHVLNVALIALLGPNIDIVRNRHNHATINRKGYNGVRYHRDVKNWSRNVLSVVVNLTATNEANGATRLIPATHNLPLRDQPHHGGTWLDEIPEMSILENQGLSVSAPEGSVLLFDGTIFHATGVNITGEDRPIIALALHTCDELVDGIYSRSHSLLTGERFVYGNSLLGK